MGFLSNAQVTGDNNTGWEIRGVSKYHWHLTIPGWALKASTTLPAAENTGLGVVSGDIVTGDNNTGLGYTSDDIRYR